MYGLSNNTLDLISSVLAKGASGLGTKTTNISKLMNRPDKESGDEIRHRPPYRIDDALGEELNNLIIEWAEKTGIYEGHLDYLRKCDFGRYVMLVYPFCNDKERLFLGCQTNVALFGLDDYFVDDERAGAKLELVGRNLSLAMSACDEPFLNKKYNADTDEGLKQHPILTAIREYMANTIKFGSPQQVARVRHEDMTLFLGMCHETSWRMTKTIAPVWEYLGCRQMNSLTTCMAMIDILEAYEVPHNIYSLPKVREVVKIAGLITVLVNDLVSSNKEEEADMGQYGIQDVIQHEDGCTPEEAYSKGVLLHNELFRIFEDESAKLMVYATPELRRFLIGLDGYIAGNYLWHTTSDRYHSK